MKEITDIINNTIYSKEVEIERLPSDKTIYVEVVVFSKGQVKSSELYACSDPSVFDDFSLVFNQGTGYYLCVINNDNYYKEATSQRQRRGVFPYVKPGKHYSCYSNLEEFSDIALKYLSPIHTLKGKSLKYSFGLEFETSKGLIPEHLCYQNGLIPLHDGSIEGIEYTSTVLKQPYGLSLLQKQLRVLEDLTTFDKNCALHIHCGGFPIDIKAVYLLYLICVNIENDLRQYNCPAVFQTDLYKDTGKNYCNAYSKKLSFSEFCYIMSAGNTTDLKNLTQVHPADTGGDRKWNINIRYYWVNFINILFYNKAKTVEFRFLRPTYNFNKIVGWMYIFNAILIYAEQKYASLEKDYARYKLEKNKRLEEDAPTMYWYTYYSKAISNKILLLDIINSVYEGTKILPAMREFLTNLRRQASEEAASNDIYGASEKSTDSKYYQTNIALYDC